MEGKFTRLKEERENISKAKEALELAEPGQLSPSEERMQVALEELQDLKGVWSELSRIWEQIDEQKEKPWLSVQPRKVRIIFDFVSRCKAPSICCSEKKRKHNVCGT